MKRRQLILAVEILLAVVYVAGMAGAVETLPPNVDEGVYAQLAHKVLQGQVPYRDFFFHQTPLYLYQQAAVFALFGVNLLAMRVPSLVAIAATGVLLSRWTAGLSGLWQAGLLAEIVWLAAPQHFDIAIGLPNALALMFAVAALVVDGSRLPHGRWILVLMLCLGVLAKPTVLLFGVILLVPVYGGRWWTRWQPWMGPMVVGAGLSFLFLQVLSHGNFWNLLVAQLGRFGSNAGYRVLMDNTLLNTLAQGLGATTVFSWNWRTVAGTLGILPFSAGTAVVALLLLACLLTVAAGQVIYKNWVLRRWQAPAILFTTYLASMLWLWDPTWPHYICLLLVPMAVLAGQLGGAVVVRLLPRPSVQLGFLLSLAMMLALPLWNRLYKASEPMPYFRQMYASLQTVNATTPVFSYYPAVGLLVGREAACGFVDPLNYVGSIRDVLVDRTNMGAAIDPGENLRRCLSATPSYVWLDKYFIFFTAKDPAWFSWLHTLAPDRIRFESELEKIYFETGAHPLLGR